MQEHLAWLEREIAAAGDSSVHSPAPRRVPMATPIGNVAGPIPDPATPVADTLLAQLVAEEKKGPPSKQGCWMIFWLILLVAGSSFGAIIYLIYR